MCPMALESLVFIVEDQPLESLDRGRKLASNKAAAWIEAKDQACITEIVTKGKEKEAEDQIKQRRESWRRNPL